jgi:hypothetical protein
VLRSHAVKDIGEIRGELGGATVNIVQWLAHSIEEYDQLRLLTEIGHTVFSPGAYIDPRNPADDKRPGLDIDTVPELKAAVDALGQPNHPRHGTCNGADAHHDTVEASKRDTPDAIIEWADVIIVHHLEHTWLIPQWHRIKGRCRVIWRTVGQSGDRNEMLMAPLHREGVEIVRYSPKERSLPGFAGEDALIRFYKDPADYGNWTGEAPLVTNITQSLYARSLANDGLLQPPGKQWTSYSFWEEATRELPRLPAGPGSEMHGGVGALSYDEMRLHLRRCRAYMYTGTQPASYTLGFIEAMMTGIPIVSMPPSWFGILPYGQGLFEAHELALLHADKPAQAAAFLAALLVDEDYATAISMEQRAKAIDLFGIDTIKAQWQA